MSTAKSSPIARLARRSAPDVWGRLWRHRTTAPEDDAWLRRERDTARWQHAVAAVRSTFGKLSGLRTVELGSGRGDFSALMATEGAAPTLVDYSEAALDQARARFARMGLRADFIQADLLRGGSELLGRFDISMSLGVVEHFRGAGRSRAIRSHLDVLRPGGLCLISVPNSSCPTYRAWKMILEIRGWWPYGLEIPYHRHELAARALKAGFADVRVLGTGFWQSVGDHLCRAVLGRSHDWSARRSCWDHRLGISLLLIGRRPPDHPAPTYSDGQAVTEMPR